MKNVFICGKFKITIEDTEIIEDNTHLHKYSTILAEIASKHNIENIYNITGDSRKQIYTKARWDFWKALYAEGFSIMQIAKLTGKDHGTIRNAFKKYNQKHEIIYD